MQTEDEALTRRIYNKLKGFKMIEMFSLADSDSFKKKSSAQNLDQQLILSKMLKNIEKLKENAQERRPLDETFKILENKRLKTDD